MVECGNAGIQVQARVQASSLPCVVGILAAMCLLSDFSEPLP